jgi:hypothetical protein
VTNDNHATEAAKQYFVNALKYWMFVCIIAGISIDVWRYRRRERQRRELMAKREEMRAQQKERQAPVKQILRSGAVTRLEVMNPRHDWFSYRALATEKLRRTTKERFEKREKP